MRISTFSALLLASMAISGVQAAPVVTNGSLTGPVANFGVPTGWSIFSGSPDTMDETSNVGIPGALDFVALPIGPSPDGGTWVGLGREGTSFVERFGQSIGGFTVGAQYVLSWYFGNFGYNGVSPAYDQPNAIEVLLDGVSLGANPLLGPDRTWVAQTLQFTATAATHEISFQPVSGNKSYLSIDGIALADAVTGEVPEPNTSWLLGAGIALALCINRRRWTTRG